MMHAADNEDESTNEVALLKEQLEKQIAQNEMLQQKLYEANKNLSRELAMRQHLSETNESLQESITEQQKLNEKRLTDLVEQFTEDKNQYIEQLVSVENCLSEKEKQIKDLSQLVVEKDKLLDQQQTKAINTTEEALEKQIEEITNELFKQQQIERESTSKRRELEENVSKLERELSQVLEALQVKREELTSTNHMLETNREELFMCRAELDMLKTIPEDHHAKGNSLFAEVEDSRKKMLKLVTSLRNKCTRMEHNYGANVLEIRGLYAVNLKLTQRWADDVKDKINEDARLRDAYKSRISELEQELREERNRLKITLEDNDKAMKNDHNFLQVLLNQKKKEIEELQDKLREHSMQRLLEEGMRHDISKQLRQWRCKAMSLEVEVSALRNNVKRLEEMEIDLKTNHPESEYSMLNSTKTDPIEPAASLSLCTPGNKSRESNESFSLVLPEKTVILRKTEEKPGNSQETAVRHRDTTKTESLQARKKYPVVHISGQRPKTMKNETSKNN